eukprot:Pompholyxophrys_sp_v1_NODE_2_length_20472_cov_5.132586.p19 type:complete len:100 gc:universal NODE_2_length_20472_cov_5.132586:11561-11262(-)
MFYKKKKKMSIKKITIKVCYKYFIPHEISELILSYLFITYHQCVINVLNKSMFRRNVKPHWYFLEKDKTIFIQAVNCNKCGGYKNTQTVLHSLRIMCNC